MLAAALLLPIVSRQVSRRWPRLDQPFRYGVFAVYVLANLYETLLFRAVRPDYHMRLELLWSYREALSKTLAVTSMGLLEEILLNVLLYIPLGYLLPYTWQRFFDQGKRVPWLVILIGFVCSALTESAQLLFRIGVFELDDMLNNTMGTAIGCLLYMLWMRRHTAEWKKEYRE